MDELRQSEIQDLHPVVVGDEEVFRLEIAMNNPFFVGRSQPVCDLEREVDGLSNGQAPLRKRSRKVSPSSNSETT